MSSSLSTSENAFVFEDEDVMRSGEEGHDGADDDPEGLDDDPASDSRSFRFFIGNALLGKVVLLVAVVAVPPMNIMHNRCDCDGSIKSCLNSVSLMFHRDSVACYETSDENSLTRDDLPGCIVKTTQADTYSLARERGMSTRDA